MINFLEIIGLLIATFLIIMINPLLNFLINYFVGWLIKITFGALFIQGLSLVGLHLGLHQIPLFCATLGVIGSFFKSTLTIKKNESKKSKF